MVILIIFFDELKLVNDYFIFVFFFWLGIGYNCYGEL